MAAPGITVIYEFQYRGAAEEWSQQYHIRGTAPADRTAWHTVLDALLNVLGGAITDRVQIIRAYCYDDTNSDAVQTFDASDVSLPVTGIIDSTGLDIAPGDAAAWVRWKTGTTNTHGKPVYLRKYFHGCVLLGATGDDMDSLSTAYKAALQAVGDDLLTPFTGWPGIATPSGGTPTGPAAVSSYVTTRTLKRRGPRP